MVSRVKYFADYRKEISSSLGLVENNDYNPKHLLSKSEIHDKTIEKHVKVLNTYEEKRNAFHKMYVRKNVIYYSIATIVALGILAVMIYCGIRVF